MNYLVGSAIQISSEVDSDQVSGTTITLLSLKNPDGTELASSESLAFGTGDEANIASCVFQTTSSFVPGKYEFVLKAVNSTKENYARGCFYLEARP